MGEKANPLNPTQKEDHLRTQLQKLQVKRLSRLRAMPENEFWELVQAGNSADHPWLHLEVRRRIIPIDTEKPRTARRGRG